MVTRLSFLLSMLILTTGKAQLNYSADKWVNLDTPSKDKGSKSYVLNEFHSFNFYHRARVKYLPSQDTGSTYKGGGVNIGRWDWIMPNSGMYVYIEGTGLISRFFNTVPSAGFLEAGIGGMFNNNKVRKEAKKVGVQWGMGVGFGFRSVVTNKRVNGTDVSRDALYGMLWPEVTSIITVGEHITVVPKYIVTPMLNNGFLGLRSSTEFLFAYRITGFLGLTARFSSETMRFNSNVQTNNGVIFSGKAKVLSMQIGISFHQGIRLDKKAKDK